jgi:DNA-binding Lrp family transcriptional regulator
MGDANDLRDYAEEDRVAISKEASEDAQAEVKRIADSIGLNLEHALKRIKESTDAKLVKAQYDKDDQEWKYSKELVDNRTRLDASKYATEILGGRPSEKHDVKINDGIQVTVISSYKVDEDHEEK